MRKNIISILTLLLALAAPGIHTMRAQQADAVSFEFDGGISGPLKQKMEQQLQTLLTAINRACTAGSNEINYTGVQFSGAETASMSIGMLWNSVHFRTQDDDILEPCLQHRRAGHTTGYQVRNIYMDMIPVDSSYQDDAVQEFVVDFDAQGRITDVNIAMGKLQYQQLMSEGERLGDLDRREQVINFCEQFANAYHKMDLQFMEDIFSDDALIITGTVRRRTQATIGMRRNPETGVQMPNQQNVTYTVHTKAEYLSNLRRIFNNQRNRRGGYVDVKFDDYEVMRHPAKPNYYGVTLRQRWSTPGYSDEGIVFLVWDFTDEENPKIQVRTWQAMDTDEREIFTLNHFRLR